jgi:hypothetical protein
MGQARVQWMLLFRPSLLWNVTPLMLILGYRRFGKTYGSHLQGSNIPRRPKDSTVSQLYLSVFVYVYCVYVSILYLCCICVRILCLCEYIVFVLYLCTYIVFMWVYCICIVFVYVYCVYVSILYLYCICVRILCCGDILYFYCICVRILYLCRYIVFG